jgi:hypothetical protein
MGSGRERLRKSNRGGLNRLKSSIFTAGIHQKNALNIDFGIKNERTVK